MGADECQRAESSMCEDSGSRNELRQSEDVSEDGQEDI